MPCSAWMTSSSRCFRRYRLCHLSGCPQHKGCRLRCPASHGFVAVFTLVLFVYIVFSIIIFIFKGFIFFDSIFLFIRLYLYLY